MIEPIIVSRGEIVDVALKLAKDLDSDVELSEKSMLLSTRQWLENAIASYLTDPDWHARPGREYFQPKHFCDWQECKEEALPDDLFCRRHRAEEDRLATPAIVDFDGELDTIA